MKSLLILTVAAGLVAGCTQSGPAQTADSSQTPAAAPAEAPPSTTAAATGSAPADQVPPPAAGSAAPASTTSLGPPPASLPTPEKPVAPKFDEVTIPAGTSLSVTVLSNLATNTSKVEDPVKGSLAKPIVIGGRTAVDAGAAMSGSVTDVAEPGRVKGRASIAFRFDRFVVGDTTHRIQTARVIHEAGAERKDDVKKGAVGAGLGAVVGGVVGGGKGAAIGAVAGGTGAVLGTKGDQLQVPAGTVVTVLLQESLKVLVPAK